MNYPNSKPAARRRTDKREELLIEEMNWREAYAWTGRCLAIVGNNWSHRLWVVEMTEAQ